LLAIPHESFRQYEPFQVIQNNPEPTRHHFYGADAIFLFG
jgi:hypothetical protein